MQSAVAGLILMGVTILVLVFIVPRLLGKSGAEAADLLSSTKDYDRDGIADYFDKCACLAGDERNDGCPSSEQTTGDATIERENKCKVKIKGNK